ncbi:hypothetical protein [Shewanella denitrificans]|uniref:hypothetical protein n=1 Tax=Shewanella denitrificans TaxID=192073 RepID=UPI00059B820A|nr:hypothetical protein [Shewanella denitrificans]
MKNFYFIAILVALSAIANASEIKTLFSTPETSIKVETFCSEKHWRSPMLVSPCIDRQFEAISAIESFHLRNYSDTAIDHPVNRILINSVKESSVVVDGKPWVDWVMAKIRFKRGMQDWLRAQGKSDTQVDYGL